jgi:acetyltransferase-like isoleucine patch superfamily enzyme
VHETCIVSPKSEIGRNATIEPYCILHAGVVVGEGSFVGSHSVLGAPTAQAFTEPDSYRETGCRIGAGAVIRSHSILYEGVDIAEGFSCGHRVTIREGSRIAEGVRVGTDADLQGHLQIGRYASLHSGVFVAQHTSLDELVWVGPRVLFLNDPHPPSDTCTHGATVRRFASIGAGAAVFASVEIGEGALVGAMALVRADVPPRAVVAGVPAKVVGSTKDVICKEGRLDPVYPWWKHYRRGFPDGVLPPVDCDG